MTVVAIVLAVSLASCATQRYGRMTPLSPGERASLNCEQIALEIEKANFFIEDVQRQRRETTGAHVLGFLGDFGVGNVMEGDAAEASGMNRLNQLKALQGQKGCTTMPATAPSSTASGQDTQLGSISTREEFEARIVGRRITGANGSMNMTIQADGTMSGTRADGAKLTGPWYFRDGYFCRESILSGKSMGWDCQVVKIDGNELVFHRNRGAGEAVRYSFK